MPDHLNIPCDFVSLFCKMDIFFSVFGMSQIQIPVQRPEVLT